MHTVRQRAVKLGAAKAVWLRTAEGLILGSAAALWLSLMPSSALAQTTLQAPSGVGVNPPGLAFPEQLVGTRSKGHTLTLTNNTSADVSFTKIILEGVNGNDFSFTTTCGINGASLPPGESCTSTIYYTPSIASGESVIQIFEGNFEQLNVFIQGTGTAVVIKPKSLAFPKTAVGTTSAPQAVEFKNVGPDALPISSVSWSGLKPFFSQTNTCGTSVPAHSFCTFSITFSPLTTGTFSATMSIGDPDPSGPQRIAVIGTGD